MYYLGICDMKNRMITYEQRADEEQMELASAQQEAPPCHYMSSHLNLIFMYQIVQSLEAA